MLVVCVCVCVGGGGVGGGLVLYTQALYARGAAWEQQYS